jgi:hypothetical protein
MMQGVEAADHAMFGSEEVTFEHPSIVNKHKNRKGRRMMMPESTGRD